jgi:hypothetical protein
MSRKFPRLLSYAVFVFFAFAVIILFPGCELYGTVGGDDTNIEGALPTMLQGGWAYTPGGGNPGDNYVITSDTITYGFGGNPSRMDYRGHIEFVSNYSSDSGLIIIKYDDNAKPSFAVLHGDSTTYNGKDYFAIYYRRLNSIWVQLANTTDLSSAVSPDTATLEEAIAKFTRMTIGNYVNWSNVMPQTRIK